MKYLIMIMISVIFINFSSVVAQSEDEIQALTQKLEQLKKKKALEEKKKIEEDKNKNTPSLQEINKKTEKDSMRVEESNTEKLAKLNTENLRRKAIFDSLSMINDFERDSAAIKFLAKKAPISIFINNVDVDSVELEVDGVSKGKIRVPYLISGLKEGWHKIFIKNNWGFVDYREGLFSADSIHRINFNAGIPKSTITVNSTPKRVEISINDSVVGLSPIKIEGLKPGVYKISMRMKGFSSYETKVKLNGLFNPKLYAKLNEEIPDSYKPIYSQPRKIVGAVLGVSAVITGILGIANHSSATDYFDKAAKNKAKSNEYRSEGNKSAAADELANEQANNDSGTQKRDAANTMLIISFVTLSFSVPLLTF